MALVFSVNPFADHDTVFVAFCSRASSILNENKKTRKMDEGTKND
jgi:hypothetical protein